ncbi:C-type lectin domain-containing protein, partial [Salmonella enterica subsp. enterica serovar Paratyphi A]
MIEPLVEGTWYEARYFCQGFGGDLVVLDSLDSYAEIVKFLNEAKLTTRDYWVGATDEGHEGEWRWVNWAKVMSGTPLWALYGSGSRYYQEPLSNNNSTQDCGYLDMTRFYYLDDEECTEMKAAICEIEPY